MFYTKADLFGCRKLGVGLTTAQAMPSDNMYEEAAFSEGSNDT